jgi:hypothetical protein
MKNDKITFLFNLIIKEQWLRIRFLATQLHLYIHNQAIPFLRSRKSGYVTKINFTLAIDKDGNMRFDGKRVSR